MCLMQVHHQDSQKYKMQNSLEPIERLVSSEWQQEPKFSDVASSLAQCSDTSGMMGLVKYLAHRELVSNGLIHFDDCPDCYRAWRSSFINTIKDLGLTADEKLDLLSKWLGKESSEHVNSSYSIRNADVALKIVWNRLDECYNSPEVIENVLFKKLDTFPQDFKQRQPQTKGAQRSFNGADLSQRRGLPTRLSLFRHYLWHQPYS